MRSLPFATFPQSLLPPIATRRRLAKNHQPRCTSASPPATNLRSFNHLTLGKQFALPRARGGSYKMKKKLIALLFLAGTSVFAGPRFFVGFGVGGYYPAPPRPEIGRAHV